MLNLYDIERGYSLGFHIHDSNDTNNNNNNKNMTAAAATAASAGVNKRKDSSPDSSSLASSLNAVETDLLSYDETELLFYVNAGEIPPILIDLVDRLNVSLFYDGCIIAQIRDFRRQPQTQPHTRTDTSSPFETRHVLLQASTQTLVADLNSICNSGHYIWTQEDKYSLESQLLVATQPVLCLDPSPRVAIARSHAFATSSRAFTADRRLKRFAVRHSEAARRRALARWHEYALPYPFRIAKMRRNMQQQQHHQQQNQTVAASLNPGAGSTNTNSSSLSSNQNNSHNHSQPHAAMARISSLMANAFSSAQVLFFILFSSSI